MFADCIYFCLKVDCIPDCELECLYSNKIIQWTPQLSFCYRYNCSIASHIVIDLPTLQQEKMLLLQLLLFFDLDGDRNKYFYHSIALRVQIYYLIVQIELGQKIKSNNFCYRKIKFDTGKILQFSILLKLLSSLLLFLITLSIDIALPTIAISIVVASSCSQFFIASKSENYLIHIKLEYVGLQNSHYIE